ncbi:hypothetical protein, partial [Cytobacillus firmus]|uniref:hypothetical protein n=1 Tax=Cytobacillus firmus TaxID=1399 RepID=UPI002FFDD403
IYDNTQLLFLYNIVRKKQNFKGFPVLMGNSNSIMSSLASYLKRCLSGFWLLQAAEVFWC